MGKSYLYERRRQYRLHYPMAERPLLHVGDAGYTIAELSEGGMRVLFNDDPNAPDDYPFEGVIRYIDGEEVHINGKVLRADEHGFSVQFNQGVGMRRIVADQIRLKKKYPMLFDHVDFNQEKQRPAKH